VDAGGTNTRAAALGLESGQLREGHAAGANWTVHGPDRCAEQIGRAVGEALGGLAPQALCLSIAGYYPPDHREVAEAWAGALWPDAVVRIEPDVLAAWAGAHGGEAGIVLISGTGSICYGQGSTGEGARAGGWGPLFGDEGSAYAAGVSGLRSLAEEVDGILPARALSVRVRSRWPELGADLRAWLRGIYRCGWGREQVAEIAEEVAGAAEAGDPACQEILLASARGLARQAMAVERALGEERLPLAVQGGFGPRAPGIMDGLRRILAEEGSGLRLTTGQLRPLDGALLLAAERLGGRELQRVVRGMLR
jgi:N-acetylglucosamine kinase-like BadF-type ATPase